MSSSLQSTTLCLLRVRPITGGPGAFQPPTLEQLLGENWASQTAPGVKNLPASAGDIRDAGSTPGLGGSPGGGPGNHPSILA